MKQFSELYLQLDQTTKTSRKLELMAQYFRDAPIEDAAWALYFLCGSKLKRLVKSTSLRSWAAEVACVPDWLFSECYDAVGDLAETISLLVSAHNREKTDDTTDDPRPVKLSNLICDIVAPLATQVESRKRQIVVDSWNALGAHECFVFNKLLTGSFRVGVSRGLVVRALAEAIGLEPEVLTHRLMGSWEPSPDFIRQLSNPDTRDARISQPYPFFLANSLENLTMDLETPTDWLAEWKWDGFRAQIIRRSGQSFIWSRGEELVTERFPELHSLLKNLPNGTVLDGEIVAYKDNTILPFTSLQRRIGLKNATKKILRDIPVAFVAFDILERDSTDIRDLPLCERRRLLQSLAEPLVAAQRQEEGDVFRLSYDVSNTSQTLLLLSPALLFASWTDLDLLRQNCREQQAEGVMVKHLQSPYRVGRPRGDWWKWKIEPYCVDAVMIYAQQGHGRRAGLFSDFTFGVWDDGKLVPFAKAYSGLTDEEMKQVDAFVRKNTIERFGPMVKIEPELVFELGFENIQLSTRHKSGVAVRFPRILAWRHDKKPKDADSLSTIQAMLTVSQATK